MSDFDGYPDDDQDLDGFGPRDWEKDPLKNGSRVEQAFRAELHALKCDRPKGAPRVPSRRARAVLAHQKGYQFGLTTDSTYPDVSRYDDHDWAAQAWHRGFKEGRTAREDQR